ncbi:MAG: VWA domain-containing protein [Candidatus Aenigmarchaeota archaeon]|nr:VWA domain-containing protein [Candidatus Aenigmarchaeota archaeon]
MDINFSYTNIPILLGLLVSVVIIHFYILKKTQKRTLLFANYEMLQKGLGKNIFNKNWVILVLRLIITSLLFLTVCKFTMIVAADYANEDYIFLIDASPSMGEAMPYVSLMSRYIADELPDNTNIGVVLFSKQIKTISLLENQTEKLDEQLSDIELLSPAGMSMGEAIESCTSVFENSNKSKIIIMFTGVDKKYELSGELNDTYDILQKNNDTMYAIGFWKNVSVVEMPESLKKYATNKSYEITTVEKLGLDEEFLLNITNKTGGKFYKLDNMTLIENITSDIAQTTESKTNIELWKYFLIISVVLLMIEWTLGMTKYKTLP